MMLYSIKTSQIVKRFGERKRIMIHNSQMQKAIFLPDHRIESEIDLLKKNEKKIMRSRSCVQKKIRNQKIAEGNYDKFSVAISPH